jgi:hypothetical protein
MLTGHFSTIDQPRCGSAVAWCAKGRPLAVLTTAAILLAASACAPLRGTQPSKDTAGAGPASPATADLTPYLATLAELAPGDPARQDATLAAARESAQLAPTSANQLRYALCLGAAGHPGSDPVQARQLIKGLLAAGNDLKPQEVELAQAFLREFDARVDLYADNARQREDYEQELKAAAADDSRRQAALSAENQRLKKSLAEAERKLSAVAEMERSLLENGTEPAPDGTAPPQ